MDEARLERKRAYDREAQRLSRARNRAYITQLERRVAELAQSHAPGTSLEAGSTLKHEALLKLFQQIQTLLGDAQVLVHESSHPHPPSKQPPANSRPRDPAANAPDTHAAVSTTALGTARQDGSSIMSEVERLSLRIDAGDIRRISTTENYLMKLNYALTKIESTVDPGSLSDAADDEDIAIRAVTLGWAATAAKHTLDPVWCFLRVLDEGIYWRSGPVERIVHLRLMRAMVLHKVHPPHQEKRGIPRFMTPTPSQQAQPHLATIDYFPWPSIRTYLIEAGVQTISDATVASFAKWFRFVWPYAAEDTYLTLRASGRFVFSEAFTHRFNQLDSYRIVPWDDAADIPFHLVESKYTSDDDAPSQPIPSSSTAFDPSHLDTASVNNDDLAQLFDLHAVDTFT